jgi:hypothetical protein
MGIKFDYCIYWNDKRDHLSVTKTERAERFKLPILKRSMTKESATKFVKDTYDRAMGDKHYAK